MSVPLQADYVIVGGGSAGCVLANRLSERSNCTVLLIEAGGSDTHPLVQMPAGMAKLISNPKWDWCYLGEPDASLSQRRFLWSAGKVLGGGSSVNGQVYIRGLRSDYQRWVDGGCAGWSFDDLLPYFRRSECFEGEPPSAAHGRDGGLSVARTRSPHPLSEEFLKTCQQNGLQVLEDYCAGEQFGAFYTLATQRDGLRCSSAKANLQSARRRSNLRILTHTQVLRVLSDQGRACGVEVIHQGTRQQIQARAEVIVSAGTIGSPLLLMRSGIGNGSELQGMGIPVLADLPSVGTNLQEHPGVAVSKRVTQPTYNSAGALQLLGELARFLVKRRGMLTTPAVQAMAFVKTEPALKDPDVQLHFLPLCYEVTPTTLCSAEARMPREPAAMIMANVCRPHSRGEVRLRSPDPLQPPLISHQMIGDSRDLDTLVRACRYVENLFATQPMAAHVAGPFFPAQAVSDNREWQQYVRDKVVPCYHPVGTCRMGGDANAPVDPLLRVRGIERLRVVDASVIPYLTSANTNAPTMAVAEKAAELIVRG